MNLDFYGQLDLDPVMQLLSVKFPDGSYVPISGGKPLVYFLDPANGSDNNNGLSVAYAFKTLPYAYSKLPAGVNATLVYLAGATAINLTAAFNWAKDYTHFVGLCAPVGDGNRARIFQDSATTGIAKLFTVSAVGCIFKNISVFQGVNDATSLIAFSAGGQRNYYENCRFAGIGNVTQDAAGAYSLELNDQESKFVDCHIGLDTVVRAGTGNGELLITSVARDEFVGCNFKTYISNAGHPIVYVASTTAIDRTLIFKDCIFSADSLNQGVTLTTAFKFAGAMVQGKIILKNCMLVADSTTAWDSAGRGITWADMAAPAAAVAGGIATKK